MADEELIVVKLDFDEGNVVSEAGAAGKKSGDAFGQNFKPQLELPFAKGLDKQLEMFSKNATESFKKLNLGETVEKMFSPGDFGQRISSSKAIEDAFAAQFGRGLDRAIQGGSSRRQAADIDPGRAAAQLSSAADVFSHRIQPFVSGLESIALFMRGAPLLSVAQMAGQAAQGFMTGKALQAAHDAAAIHFPGGRPGDLSPAAAIERRVAASGVASSTAAGATGGFFAGGLMATLGRLALPVTAAGGGLVAATALGDAIKDLGIEGANTTVSLHSMAGSLGMTVREFLEFKTRAGAANVDVDNFRRSFIRLGVTVAREMPEIRRQAARVGDELTESSIKVDEAERNIIAAREGRVAATNKVIKAESELTKFEATGAEQRQQQVEAARLGVTGAQLGVVSAQMQARQAAVGLRFAPQEAALAEIRGKETVRGAELGR